ncbi:MAG: hypothetical protein WBD40_12935 [Tepidisphaeraceae bacterium]
MAVVQSLGVVNGVSVGGGLRGSFLVLAVICAGSFAPIVRADEWISPPSFEDVPVQSPAEPDGPAIAPQAVVVPLPTGLETGAACLAGMAAARWWKRRR